MQNLEENAQRDAEAAADTILELERETEEMRRECSEDKRRWEDQVEVWTLCGIPPFRRALKSRALSRLFVFESDIDYCVYLFSRSGLCPAYRRHGKGKGHVAAKRLRQPRRAGPAAQASM